MEPSTINLSYYITTFNKLPYLKIALTDLIENRQPDEEIVVSDGGSKDGTAQWLQEQYDAGRIQGFMSAPDKGEAHGVNRALLACRGTLLKWINDDDVFCYPAIRECKEFMLANPDVDVIGADGFDNYTGQALELIEHTAHFAKWKQTKEPFGFYGPGLMLRHSSLPLIGLTHSLSRFVDNEYTYRIMCLPLQVVWYRQPMFVRIINEDSNTLKFLKIKNIEQGINDKYREIATGRPVSELNRRRAINSLKQKAYGLLHRKSSAIKAENFAQQDFATTYAQHRATLYQSFDPKKAEKFTR
ncbi:glycosyltransferase family 2 protein [Hymenobacter sp. BT523]|uniref:glycosyltransferase family A protein n=1 Tax=Hymenobacter sp. BT523 TaxID=2795725 RepID=UPI0018EE03BA|nr:glycosyltransferase family A protein [Hymenobacter sp. BT523]MBJ6108288.1 glycosyltransferase family 2 protein [Hymenobacter sp. BT523]